MFNHGARGFDVHERAGDGWGEDVAGEPERGDFIHLTPEFLLFPTL